MKKIILTVLCLFQFSIFGLQLFSADAPIRVLILAGRSSHDWRATTPALIGILESTGRFQCDVTTRPSALTPEILAPYGLVLCNWTSYKDHTELEEPWLPVALPALLDFVKNGKGHMFIHVAGSNFYDQPEYQKLTASGSYKYGKYGASKFIAPGTPLPVRATAAKHPITDGMPPLTIIDELYSNMGFDPGATPIVEAYADKKYRGNDDWHPAVVVNNYGKGRNVSNVLGHSVACMDNPLFKTILQRSAEWAATGKVTIPLISFADYKLPAADPKSYQGHAATNPVAATDKTTAHYDPAEFSAAIAALLPYKKYEPRDALLKLEQLVAQAAVNPGTAAQAADQLIVVLLQQPAGANSGSAGVQSAQKTTNAPSVAPAPQRILTEAEIAKLPTGEERKAARKAARAAAKTNNIPAVPSTPSDASVSQIQTPKSQIENPPDAANHLLHFLSLLATDATLKQLDPLFANPAHTFQLTALLERMNTTRAKSHLASLISKTRNPDILIPLIQTAGRMNADSTLAPIRRQLKANADNPVLVQTVLLTLSQINNIDAYEILLETLADKTLLATAQKHPVQFIPFAETLLLNASLKLRDPVAKKLIATTLRQLAAADKPPHIRAAALNELYNLNGVPETAFTDPAQQAAAIRYLINNPAPATASQLAKILPAVSPAQQLPILAALAKLRDPATLPAIEQLAASQNTEIRNAALIALGSLGNANTAEQLLRQAADTENPGTLSAIDTALTQITDPATNQILLDKLPPAPAPAAIIILNQLLQRRTANATPALLALLDKQPALAPQIFNALGELSVSSEIPALLKNIPANKISPVLAQLARREPRQTAAILLPLFPRQAADTQTALLAPLAATADKTALQLILKQLDADTPETRAAAIKALVNWPDATPAENLLAFAENTKETREQILTLRTLATLLERDKTLAPATREKLTRRALALATRDEEKQLFKK